MHLRSLHKRARPQAQEFRTHVVAYANPVEYGVAHKKYHEAASHCRADENHDVQERDGAPYFRKTLQRNIRLAAEIALYRTYHQADEHARSRKDYAEYQRDPHAVHNSCVDIATAGIYAEGMLLARTERKAYLRRRQDALSLRRRRFGLHVYASIAIVFGTRYFVVVFINADRALIVPYRTVRADVVTHRFHIIGILNDWLAVLFKRRSVYDSPGIARTYHVGEHAEHEYDSESY